MANETIMENEKLLKDYPDREKGAYLGAIASIATADHSASEEELEYILRLADSADISDTQRDAVSRAATELSDEELVRCLDILKTSDLRFSLVTELINFAQSDSNYTDSEKKNVEKIAEYLDVNEEQFSLLDQFVDKTSRIEASPDEMKKPGFLASLGLEDKFKSAGIDWKKIRNGLLSVAGPALLASMFSGKRRSALSSTPGTGTRGGLNSLLGGMGLSSLLNGLGGGRGFGNAGGLLSRLIQGFKR